jgi:hypothetical protein
VPLWLPPPTRCAPPPSGGEDRDRGGNFSSEAARAQRGPSLRVEILEEKEAEEERPGAGAVASVFLCFCLGIISVGIKKFSPIDR